MKRKEGGCTESLDISVALLLSAVMTLLFFNEEEEVAAARTRHNLAMPSDRMRKVAGICAASANSRPWETPAAAESPCRSVVVAGAGDSDEARWSGNRAKYNHPCA